MFPTDNPFGWRAIGSFATVGNSFSPDANPKVYFRVKGLQHSEGRSVNVTHPR